MSKPLPSAVRDIIYAFWGLPPDTQQKVLVALQDLHGGKLKYDVLKSLGDIEKEPQYITQQANHYEHEREDYLSRAARAFDQR